MPTLEKRMDNMDNVVEFLNQTATGHSTQLAKVATTEEINTLLKTYMKDKGIGWE
jgi:hypothetical protein